MEQKACTKCGCAKPADAFGISRNHKTGVNPWCKACVNASGAAWKLKNAERVLSKARENYHANRDTRMVQMREWKAENQQARREYRVANRAKLLALVRKRHAAQLQRTPPWADHAKIEAVYVEAEAMRALGVEVEVDHIIPLQGRTVSGLHTEDNLRLMIKTDNRAKGNRLLADVAPIAIMEYA